MKKRFYATLATVVLTGTLLSSVAMAQETGTGTTTPPTGVTGTTGGTGSSGGSTGGGESTNIPGHPRVNEVDQRDNNQQNRIDKGEADGQLSKGQATRDQAHLDHQEAVQKNQEAHNGGHLTKAEQRHDNRSLNKSSHKIHRQRHDGKRHKQ